MFESFLKKYRESDPLSEVTAYMTKKRSFLLNGYRSPEGLEANCAEMATEIAGLLIQVGEQPHLIIFENSSGLNPIHPKIFSGAKEWGSHIVCVNKDMVYDPLLEAPTKFEEYKTNMFEESVNTHVDTTYEELLKLFK